MQFIKFKDGKLYTPIIQYRQGGAMVTNIGNVHVGTAAYYHILQQKLNHIPFGFYEFIKPLRSMTLVPPEKRQYLEGVQDLREVYKRLAVSLGIVSQHVLLGKYPPSWENVDMTLDELVCALPERSLRKMAMTNTKLKDISTKELATMTKTMMHTLHYLSLLPFINEAVFNFLLGYGASKVILNKRNERLFQALATELEEREHIGTIYGAAHLTGIDRFLRSKGFTREGEEWIIALEM